MAKTDEEYNAINSDSTIDTFEYPLDYEIVKQGNKYKDKSVGNNKFTWIYCAVPLNKRFDTKIKIEILDELYLPFGNGKEKPTNFEKNNSDFLKNLEEEALKQTGNWRNTNKNLRGTLGWYASGIIKVWDERLNYNFLTNQFEEREGYLPVPGCQVRANRWFTTKTALTNSSGYFYINHEWPDNTVDYSIKWDRDDFDIRDGSYGQTYYYQNNLSSAWYLNITEYSMPDTYMYAHVHRAAWYYYYNNTFNVTTPPSRTYFQLLGIIGLIGEKMHLGVKQGGSRSHYFQFNGNWVASQIKLNFDLNITPNEPTDDELADDARKIFATTIHELTHATHWKFGMNTTVYVSNVGQAGRLAESWARGVEWYITRIVYKPKQNPLDDVRDTQLMSLGDMSGGTALSNEEWYTPLFIDLIDEYNQVVQQGGRPDDKAKGYSINELENFLKQKPINWYNYRDYLRDNSSNTTETDAIKLFNDYD